MRASIVVLCALALAACSYDLSGFGDAGGTEPSDAAGPCSPLAPTSCGAMRRCSAEIWSGTLEARCTTPGTSTAACTGASVCATGYVCVGAVRGSGTCVPFCSTESTSCAAGTCSTEVLASFDGQSVFRCR